MIRVPCWQFMADVNSNKVKSPASQRLHCIRISCAICESGPSKPGSMWQYPFCPFPWNKHFFDLAVDLALRFCCKVESIIENLLVFAPCGLWEFFFCISNVNGLWLPASAAPRLFCVTSWSAKSVTETSSEDLGHRSDIKRSQACVSLVRLVGFLGTEVGSLNDSMLRSCGQIKLSTVDKVS